MSDDLNYVMWGIQHALNRIISSPLLLKLKPGAIYGTVIVDLGDGTPEATVDAVKFYNWIKSPKSTEQDLKKFLIKKSKDPVQHQLNLD